MDFETRPGNERRSLGVHTWSHRKGSGSHNRSEPTAMKFGIHNSSWLDRPDPADAFEAVKGKAQGGGDHGFVGAPDEPGPEGRAGLGGVGAAPGPIPLAPPGPA